MKKVVYVSIWDIDPNDPQGRIYAETLTPTDERGRTSADRVLDEAEKPCQSAPESSKLKAFDVRKDKMDGRMKYYEMQHCGGLDEALKTKKPITEAEFNRRLKDYKYYCFDKRIGCHRYILKDIPNNYKKQTIWLLRECRFDS